MPFDKTSVCRLSEKKKGEGRKKISVRKGRDFSRE
jgi:hypothetical protein